jgi:hypothetical protein
MGRQPAIRKQVTQAAKARPDHGGARAGRTVAARVEIESTAGVPWTIEPQRGRALLDTMLGKVEGIAQIGRVLDAVARLFPTDALQLLVDGGLLLHFERRTHPPFSKPTDRTIAMLGEAGAHAMSAITDPCPPNATGTFVELINEVRIGNDIETEAQLVQATCHELLHALDFLLGDHGRWFSTNDDWARIHEATKRGGRFQFPNSYAATSPQEFFVEAGAIRIGAGGHRVSGQPAANDRPEDLLRLNPLAHEALTHFLTKSVAAARVEVPLAQQIALAQNYKAEWERAVPSAKRTPEQRETFKLMKRLIAALGRASASKPSHS